MLKYSRGVSLKIENIQWLIWDRGTTDRHDRDDVTVKHSISTKCPIRELLHARLTFLYTVANGNRMDVVGGKGVGGGVRGGLLQRCGSVLRKRNKTSWSASLRFYVTQKNTDKNILENVSQRCRVATQQLGRKKREREKMACASVVMVTTKSGKNEQSRKLTS